MTVKTKQIIIFVLGLVFLGSLIIVQWAEVVRRQAEEGLRPAHITVAAASKQCVDCHRTETPGIVGHWTASIHAEKGVGCYDCHKAAKGDADAYDHEGSLIATIVTPRDCAECHPKEAEQFQKSHHARAGNILASLDNFLAETVEGARAPFNPHSPTPGRPGVTMVNGMASVNSGCKQCHGAKVALIGTKDGKTIQITVDDLKPGEDGKPTDTDMVALVQHDPETGRPLLASSAWPNTGIGRLNLDGSLGSCSACHSRHDFSPRRARQPENCGKCHLGPDHPQKEIYEESKHGVAFRDLKDQMRLDSTSWVLGKDYAQAPTCATCHMSANTKTLKDGEYEVTHDPGERISWTNRPPISLVMDTDAEGHVVTETDPTKRRLLVHSSWQEKRREMKNVCTHCHTENYVTAFYAQYDDFVVNYNEKFAKPGTKIMAALKEQSFITATPFDDEIEWTWFYLWHHEGRRARHGASMMAPDYAHWHGMYEVAERFYEELIPQALEAAQKGAEHGNAEGAEAVRTVVQEILDRPEHAWFEAAKKEQKETTPATTTAADAASANTDESVAAQDAADESATDTDQTATEEAGENAAETAAGDGETSGTAVADESAVDTTGEGPPADDEGGSTEEG